MAIKFLNTVAVDTDVLYVDAASNEVGIGTTSPGSKLEVVEARSGSSASDQTHYTLVSKSTISSGTPGTGGIKVVYDDGTNEHAFGLVAGSSSADFLTSGPMHWYTNSDLNTQSATGFAMTIDTSQRVGIGLTNPSQKLTVSGNVMAGRYYSTGTTVYYLDPSDTTTSAYVAGPVRIRQSSSYQSTALEVTAATGAGGDDGVFIKNYWAGGTPTVASKNPFLSIGCADSNGHKSTIYLGEDASPANQESKIEYAHDSADLRIFVKGQGTYREHVRFGDPGSSTARTQFTGNVGIGTAPSAALHVSGVSRATSGFSTDGNNRFYTWRALNNTASSSNQYYRIARVTGSQSTRFIIELAGRSSSYGNNALPAFGKIVGQLNNDNNFDIVYYNASATDEVVDEVGQVDVSTVSTDIYVRVGQFAELTATAHISDGNITTYDSNSGSTSAPTGYVQATEYKLWNTGNDGANSGLDADLLDGQQGSYYLNYNNFTNTPTIPTDFVSAANGGTFSGNVGINKTSPQQKLHVGGRGLFETGGSTADATTSTYEKGITLTGGNMRLVIDTSDVSNGGSYIQTRHSSTTYPSAYYTLALNPLGGKVGIGTNSPSHKLEVVGDGVVVSDGTDQGIIYLRSDRTDTYIKENGNYQIETGAPSGILFECDSNSNGNGIFNIKRQGASRFYITDGGNIGLATTSPRTKLDINGPLAVVGGTFTSGTSGADSNSASGIVLRRGKKILSGIPSSGNEDFYLRNLIEQDTSNNINIGQTGTGLIGNITLNTGSSGNVIFRTIGSESARIDSSGRLGLGTTSPTARFHLAKALSSNSERMGRFVPTRANSNIYGAVGLRFEGLDYGNSMEFIRTNTYNGGALKFVNGTTQVGSIVIGSSGTTYNTSSDYRLKENIVNLTGGIERVKQLQPKRFNFIQDPNVIVDGFLAHEAQTVVPQAVTGEKDGAYPNGDPIYQGIDQAKIIPLLTAALKEAIAKIENLETRIQALENN